MTDFIMPEYMTELTTRINEYVQRDHQTPALGHQLFWDDLSRLRSDNNRDDIIKNWIYGVSFTCAENSHKNGDIPFGKKLTWEQSFVFGFLMYEFH
jgi:hypothetical protein